MVGKLVLMSLQSLAVCPILAKQYHLLVDHLNWDNYIFEVDTYKKKVILFKNVNTAEFTPKGRKKYLVSSVDSVLRPNYKKKVLKTD